MAETWWPGLGECNVDNRAFFYSGNKDPKHRKCVDIVITKELWKSVVDFVPYSDRTALLRLRARPSDLNKIQVYAPTAEVKELLKLTKKHEVNIIMGDFNAKIGKGTFGGLVGSYDLGQRNERGDRRLQFCQEESMKVTNT